MTTPNPTTFDFLQSVDGPSSDDVWAVGASDDGTLALHWDGSTWKRVASFGSGELDIMLGVSASSSDDVWGVGNYGSHQPPHSLALAEHWNGTVWKNVTTVNPGHRNNVFNGVDASASDDVWAVGAARDRHVTTPLAEHWNGTSWQRVEVDGTRKALTGVSAVASGDVWAVGNSNGGAQCLIEHWDGSAWSRLSQ